MLLRCISLASPSPIRCALTTLTMTNHYASLTVQHLQKSHEKYSPLRAEKSGSDETFDEAYWSE